MKRIVVIGARGQLGTDLVSQLGATAGRCEVVGLDRPTIDVTHHAETRTRLLALAPAVVINTAAFHRVDDCELDAASAFGVNTVAVHELARTCRELDAVLVHLSTDYVFGAERARMRPYAESDAPGPVSVYGASKLAGEHVLRSTWPKHFVVRTSGLYGRATSQSKGGNFVEIMLRMASVGRPLRVVADQHLAPTSTHVLAQRLIALLDTEAYGLYHLTAGGECSWYEFAEAIFELAGLRPDLSATTTEAYGARADRPRYSVLDNAAARALGLQPLPPWRDSLAEYLALTGRR